METVTNIASAASRAIWGDTTTTQQTAAGTEPESGRTGNVEAGEPYDKGNDVNITSTSESKDTALPTQHNYQKDTTTTSTGTTIPTPETNTTSATTGTTSKVDTATPAATTGTTSKVDTATPSTNTTDNSITSKMSDNLPSTSLDKTSSTNNNTSTSGPPTDSVTPAAGSSTTPKDQTTTDNTNTSSTNESKDKEDTKEATSAELKAAGIEETKKEGDHAPKYDTFKTADGPHIGGGKNDGRVGPEIEKGDLKEFEEKEEAKKDVGEAKVDSATSGSGSAAGSEHASSVKKDHHAAESGDSVDSAGKEKVSLKDKIKAKLHKH